MTYPSSSAVAIHGIDIKLNRSLAFVLVFEEEGLDGYSKLVVIIDSGGTTLSATGERHVSQVI